MLSSRCLVRLLHHSSGLRASTNVAHIVRYHRFSSSSSTDSDGSDVSRSVVVTQTKQLGRGGNAEEQVPVKLDICGDVEDDVEEEMEEMLQEGPVGKEWGGPTRGGVLGEPTRFGDWERKGRCSDF